MAYVPGSHNAGGLIPVDITHRSEPYNILADPLICGAQPKWVDVEPGSVIWHHGFTVHQASENQSDSVRRVFTIVYIASDATRRRDWAVLPTLIENRLWLERSAGQRSHRVARSKELTEPAINGGRRNWAADPRLNRRSTLTPRSCHRFAAQSLRCYCLVF